MGLTPAPLSNLRRPNVDHHSLEHPAHRQPAQLGDLVGLDLGREGRPHGRLDVASRLGSEGQPRDGPQAHIALVGHAVHCAATAAVLPIGLHRRVRRATWS